MHATEFTNYIIATFAASLPAIYVIIVARVAQGDLKHTDEISREPGQTNHTAILDLHSADGH